MTEDEAFDAIRAFMVAVNNERRHFDALYTPLEAINKAYQNGPTPKGPFGLITYLGDIDNGEADHFCYGEAVILERSRQATDPDLQDAPVATESRTRSVVMKFRFDFYASRAGNYAQIFLAAFRSSRAQADLPGMMPREFRNVTSQPELIGQKWEGRAHFEIEFVTLNSDPVAIDSVNSGRFTIERQGVTTGNTELSYEKGN